MSKFNLAVAAFATARSATDYQKAKNMAAGLSLDAQFKLIDNAIAARKRLMVEGVL